MAGCRALALAAILVAGASGCRSERPALPPVILISVDTLRSDRLPAYGYEGVSTPHLDALAEDGIVFERAFSPCPMTLPSHVSMLTGTLPTRHQVRNNVGYPFDPSHATIPSALRALGYETGAVVSSYVLRGETGLREIFDFYDDSIPLVSGDALGSHQRAGEQTLDSATQWLRGRGAPFFLMFHIYEPHAPYEPPEPFRSRYASAYDGEVAASDAIVGSLIAELVRLDLYHRALIIFTSDHGEGLDDHGEDQHGILLYREAIQVPLIIKLPGGERAGTRVSSGAQLVDIFPTVMKLLDAPAVPGLDGSSLLDRDEASSQRPIYAETFYPRLHLGWSELRSIVSGDSHYIEAPVPELYDLEADPKERINLASTDRRELARLRAILAKYPAGLPDPSEVDPEVASRLAALGYIGSVRSAAKGPLPNPIEHLDDLSRMKDAFELAGRGQLEESAAALRRIIEANPSMFDAWDKLGEVLRDAGRYVEAERVYRDAIARFPEMASGLTLALASVYLRMERFEDAFSHAEAGASLNPARAHELKARIALARNDPAQAERELQSAIDPSRPEPSLLLLRAEILLAGGDLTAALATVEEAERRLRDAGGSSLPRLEFLRGDLLARTDRPDEAAAAYRKEIDRYPSNLQAWANLAIIRIILGERAEARALLDEMVRRNPHPRARELAAATWNAFGETEEARRFR